MPHVIVPKWQEVGAPRTRAVSPSWRPLRTNPLRSSYASNWLVPVIMHERRGRHRVSAVGIPLVDPARPLRLRPEGEPGYRRSAEFARSAALELRATVLASLSEASVQREGEPWSPPTYRSSPDRPYPL